MSWEKTDEWPDGRAEGGAFRAAAEVIVATRDAPTLADRFRVWWHSTPDHPFAAMPMRVVLTPSWIYVETRRGDRQRARVEQILGSRREAGRVIYAVADGDDLVVADRKGDALELALDEKVGAKGEWRSDAATIPVFLFALFGLVVSIGVTLSYRDEAIERIHRGLTTSESALGLYAGLGGILLMLLWITFFPQRYIADTVGITSKRGLFGWVRTTIPVERVSEVVVDRFTVRSKNGTTYTTCFVEVLLRDPSGKVRIHHSGAKQSSEARFARERARQIASQVARLYDVEFRDLPDRR